MYDLDEKALNDLVGSYSKPKKRKPAYEIAARTGIMSLDLNLGGGLPSGLVEVFGEESSGKTGMVGQIAGYNQRSGRIVAWLPSERIDPPYLDRLGVIRKFLPLISEREVHPFFREFRRAVLIIDSLTTLRPWDVDEWNEYILDFLGGLQGVLNPGQCVIATNHVRARLSAEPGKVFAGGTESAGRNLTDLFNVRLELSRKDVTERSYTQVVNVVSNVLSSPSRYLEFPAVKGLGINRKKDLILTGANLGVLERRGSNLYFRNQHVANGLVLAVQELMKFPMLEEAIVHDILQTVA